MAFIRRGEKRSPVDNMPQAAVTSPTERVTGYQQDAIPAKGRAAGGPGPSLKEKAPV